MNIEYMPIRTHNALLPCIIYYRYIALLVLWNLVTRAMISLRRGNLKYGFCAGVFVLVGVILERHLTIGLLDFIGGSILCYSERFIEITSHCNESISVMVTLLHN